MNLKTAKQIENLNVALMLWNDTPKEKVVPGLSVFRMLSNDEEMEKRPRGSAQICGSLACFGGHVASWEYFQKQGVRPNPDSGSPRFSPEAPTASEDAYEVSLALFGDYNLFRPRGTLHLKHLFLQEDDRDVSDHEIVVRRIQAALADPYIREWGEN